MRAVFAMVLAVALAAAVHAGDRDPWPSRPIKMVVPQAAGGTADARARQVCEHLAKALGQAVFVENRPGAGQTIGAEYVAKAAPDGYTLLYGTIADQSVAPAVYRDLPYDPRTDFAPVIQGSRVPPLLVASPRLGVHAMKELIALARSKPGQLTIASFGNGTLTHLLVLQLNREAGIELVHVPYKNAAHALTDVVAGHVDLMFDYLITSGPFIKAGKLMPLMLVGANRSKAFPDIPSASDVGLPAIRHNAWGGVFAPAGTPKEIVQRLNAALARVYRAPDVAQTIIDGGGEIVAGSAEAFRTFIRAEQDELAALARAAGARVE